MVSDRDGESVSDNRSGSYSEIECVVMVMVMV